MVNRAIYGELVTSSKGDSRYLVRLFENGMGDCECVYFKYHRDCKHLKATWEKYNGKVQARRAAEAPRRKPTLEELYEQAIG